MRCRDLLMGGRDAANNIWQAHGNENTAVQLHSLQGFSKLATTGAPTSMQRLAQWALNNQAALQAMQAHVHQLMDSR